MPFPRKPIGPSDSHFWLAANGADHTFLLERHLKWIELQPQEVQRVTSLVSYTTLLSAALQDLNNEELLSKLHTSQVPYELKRTDWHSILVDSPEGYCSKAPGLPGNPGRDQSIYVAMKPDDCNRRVEMAYFAAV